VTDTAIDIVTYRPELQPYFERLNRIWLEEHALLEPVDLEYLQDPEGHILAGGGEVFFAAQGDVIVGTAPPSTSRRVCGSWPSWRWHPRHAAKAWAGASATSSSTTPGRQGRGRSC
jgi:hypothetical protein